MIPQPRPIRVVIADDHPMFRYGLTAALAASSELDIVGEAADGTELLAIVDATAPDVVLTDLAMPGLDGAVATRTILARIPLGEDPRPAFSRRWERVSTRMDTPAIP